jgi:hypothetical protein
MLLDPMSATRGSSLLEDPMKRDFLAIAIAALAINLCAAAQNTTPQAGTTQNQNSPQMQVAPAQPSQTPAAGSKLVEPKAAETSTPAGTEKKTGDPKPAENSADAKPVEAQPVVKTPHTEMVEAPSSGPQSADPLLQPPPLPENKSTLVGGIVRKIDGVSNRVVIAPFGSSKTISVQFDERSHIYRDGHETTMLGIKKGDRIYADTMLIGPRVFARNLRVVTTMSPAEASGQIVAYDPAAQTVRLIDKLTNMPVTFHIAKDTELRSKTGQATASDIRAGTLVSVVFAPGHNGGDARQISILAVPGTKYIFAGRITNFDIHNGIVDVDNQSDGRNYELHFPPEMENRGELRVGAQVAANATFDGHTYTTRQITIMPEQSQNAQQ